MNVYDIINNISSNNDIMFSEEEIEEYYNPYIVVDFFSRFEDTVFLANEANSFIVPLSKWKHYLFMHSIVRKRYRSVKRFKKNTSQEDNIKLLMEYYEISREKAKEILKLLTNINIEEIKTSLYGNRGGIIK